MSDQSLAGMRVAILATDDFEQVELTEPRKALDEAGAGVAGSVPSVGWEHLRRNYPYLPGATRCVSTGLRSTATSRRAAQPR